MVHGTTSGFCHVIPGAAHCLGGCPPALLRSSSATWVGVITTVLWTAPMSQGDRRRGLLHQQIIDDGSTRRRWWCYQVTLAGPLHVKIPLGGQFPSWSAPPVSARLNSMRRGGCKKWPRGEWPAEQQLRLFNNPSRGATYKTWPS